MLISENIIGKHFHIHYMGTKTIAPVIVNHSILQVDVDKGVCFVALLRTGDDSQYTGYRLMSLHEIMPNMLHDTPEAMEQYCKHIHSNISYEEEPMPSKDLLN